MVKHGSKHPVISIIIPCFNEQEVIETTFERLMKVQASVDWQSEILFIDDGSRDRTLEILKKLCKEKNDIQIISFARNFGHQAALSAGLRYARGDAAIILDADLQDPPELMDKMVSLWLAGKGKIIYGKRTFYRKERWFKKLTSKYFYRVLNNLSAIKMPVDTGDFRLVDRQVIDSFNALPERNKYIRGLFPWMGYKSIPLEYERDTRQAGETKYTLKKMLHLARDGMISFSKKPLQLSTTLGMFTIIVAFCLSLYIILSFLSPKIDAVPIWISVMVIIFFLSGIQLFVIGILGTYIGQLFDEIQGRPEYIIDDIYKNE